MTDSKSRLNRRALFLSRSVFILRVFLGITFLYYGITKILGGQFFYGDWTLNKKTVDGGYLVFSFYGYSTVYARFLGICEALPAALLFFRKTATLGAAALFAISLNITVMDFCYGGMLHRAKYFALVFTIMLGFLLLCDWPRLQFAFWPPDTPLFDPPPKNAKRRLSIADLAQMPRSLAGRLSVALGVAIFLVIISIQIVAQVTPTAHAVASQWLIKQGWKDENVRYLRMHFVEKPALFRKMTVVLDYEIRTSSPPILVHVQESRSTMLSKWRVDKITEESE